MNMGAIWIKTQKEVFRVQILRLADIFLTFPWGYIGVLGLYGTRATSALTLIRQNLIFFSLKGRYSQKGEIRIPWIILLQLYLLYPPSHGSTEDCLGCLELGWSWDQPQQDKTWFFNLKGNLWPKKWNPNSMNYANSVTLGQISIGVQSTYFVLKKITF